MRKEGGMIHAPYSAVGEQCMDTFRHGIDACHAMNIPVYLAPAFFAGFPMTVKDRENIALNLRTACEYAEDKNVCVAFESAYSAEQVIALRTPKKSATRIFGSSMIRKIQPLFAASAWQRIS